MTVVGRRVRLFAAASALAVAIGCLAVVDGADATPGPLHTVIGTKLLGHSVGGRAIVAYHLGDPRSRTKAIVLGQMHGDEHAGVVIADAIIHGRPVRGIDLWVIPTINPDGNHANRRQNAHGVDLNRNWPDRWRPLTGAFNSGPRALSEPETRAMYSFLKAVRPTLMVSLHQPLYGVDSTDGGTRDPAFRNRLARNLGLPLKAFTCSGACYGSMTAWITHHQAGAAITVEYGPHPSRTQLTRAAPPAILAAFGARYDTAAAHNPIGHVDVATSSGSTVRFAGWTIDPDNLAAAITVRVLEGAKVRWQKATAGYRAAVNRTYHATGNHGFDARFTAGNGRHIYCVQFVNIGPGSADPKVCRSLTVDGSPKGHLDALAPAAPGSVELAGWMFDPDATATSGQVAITVDGAAAGTAAADLPRPDVNAHFRIQGNHGFATTLTGQAAGTHTYCVAAVNLGPPAANRALGCATITVSA